MDGSTPGSPSADETRPARARRDGPFHAGRVRMSPNGATTEAVVPTVSIGRASGADSLWSETWRRFRRHHLAILGGLVLALMVLAVVVGPFVYRVPIDAIDFKAKLKGPSWAHPL